MPADPGNTDPEYLMDCLARQVLAWRDTEGRGFAVRWINSYTARHGQEARERLLARIEYMDKASHQ